ncbi:hypothetical protein ALC57_00759 [Trachymyrmex cornetzi]|uniref:Uncharacterized protein n=1 Tax=Trachymyrmex cornetzi TaxID=471704 RepID=A0A151JR95_9HYME|nr:hypothetical protein ALC57_00759 [Trachymyrmex cornetzi]
MSALGCHANHGATSAQRILAESDLKTTLGPTQLDATVGPRLGQRWQYVGSRLSRQSRRDVGPTSDSRPLSEDNLMPPSDQGWANVGSMSALGCHANHGATSAQPPIADPYLKTT